MSDKMIMVFKVTFDPETAPRIRMESKHGLVTFIPFGGTVESDLFTGTIQPGAADVQVTNAAGIRHMCAKYIFTGKDYTGADCHLFVENNGFFEPASRPRPFHACPTFMTDSAALADYLEAPHFRAEGHSHEGGVDIQIYDIDKQED